MARPLVGVRLLVDVGDVVSDRPLGDREETEYLPVAVAAREAGYGLELAAGELGGGEFFVGLLEGE